MGHHRFHPLAVAALSGCAAVLSGCALGEYRGEVSKEITVRGDAAEVHDCPDWRRANLIDLSHLNSSNFGCATRQALAIHVADPRDLIVGRPLEPASGDHAYGAMERYRTDAVKPFVRQGAEPLSGSGSSR